MILNPVISGGGAEKEYKITDKTGYLNRATAKAGEIVVIGQLDFGSGPSLGLENGVRFEISRSNSNPLGEASARIPTPFWFFVMPAQDVTIYMYPP